MSKDEIVSGNRPRSSLHGRVNQLQSPAFAPLPRTAAANTARGWGEVPSGILAQRSRRNPLTSFLLPRESDSSRIAPAGKRDLHSFTGLQKLARTPTSRTHSLSNVGRQNAGGEEGIQRDLRWTSTNNKQGPPSSEFHSGGWGAQAPPAHQPPPGREPSGGEDSPSPPPIASGCNAFPSTPIPPSATIDTAPPQHSDTNSSTTDPRYATYAQAVTRNLTGAATTEADGWATVRRPQSAGRPPTHGRPVDLRQEGRCFQCLARGRVARSCREPIKCRVCRQGGHRQASCPL